MQEQQQCQSACALINRDNAALLRKIKHHQIIKYDAR